MNNAVIVKLMTNLINKKFYATKEDAIEKLDVYFAMSRIDETQHAELVMLTEEKYAEVI